MTFKGGQTVRSKTVKDKRNYILRKCDILWKNVDIDNRMNNCFKTTYIINSAFIRQKNLNKTRIKLHNTIYLSALLYNSQNWTVEARDAKRIMAAEMKYKGKVDKLDVL